jgi:hypothetical protein
MNPELDDDEELVVLVLPVAALVLEPVDPVSLLDDVLLPLTDSPTEPPTAVTVPETGEVSVVSLSACSSDVTVDWSWLTVASSSVIVAGLVASPASLEVMLWACSSSVNSWRDAVCSSEVIVVRSEAQELSAVAKVSVTPTAVPSELVAMRRKTYVVSGCNPVTMVLAVTAVVPEPASVDAVDLPSDAVVPYWKR